MMHVVARLDPVKHNAFVLHLAVVQYLHFIQWRKTVTITGQVAPGQVASHRRRRLVHRRRARRSILTI